MGTDLTPELDQLRVPVKDWYLQGHIRLWMTGRSKVAAVSRFKLETSDHVLSYRTGKFSYTLLGR
jgi:hypothetical protein